MASGRAVASGIAAIAAGVGAIFGVTNSGNEGPSTTDNETVEVGAIEAGEPEAGAEEAGSSETTDDGRIEVPTDGPDVDETGSTTDPPVDPVLAPKETLGDLLAGLTTLMERVNAAEPARDPSAEEIQAIFTGPNARSIRRNDLRALHRLLESVVSRYGADSADDGRLQVERGELTISTTEAGELRILFSR